MREFFVDTLASPVGTVRVVTDDACLRALDFADYEQRIQALLTHHYGAVRLIDKHDPLGVSTAVARYFSGDFSAFQTIPMATHGSDFQRRVWRALCDIPVGTTISYGELARHIGNPAASRAVGLSNGANPIAIAVPCHRVIGANGDLTGYSGGMERKRRLLMHEDALLLLEASATAPALATVTKLRPLRARPRRPVRPDAPCAKQTRRWYGATG